MLVVGHPRKMDNSESESMKHIRYFVAAFRKRFPGIPVELVDERFTSRMALDSMIEGGMKSSARRVKANVDKISASLILQTYLESKHS